MKLCFFVEEIKNGEGKFIFCCGEEKRRKLIGKGKHIFAEEKKNKVVKKETFGEGTYNLRRRRKRKKMEMEIYILPSRIFCIL